MAFYPEKVSNRFQSAANVGIYEFGTKGKGASFVCGSFVDLSVRINADLGRIDGAKFRTNGCGFMIAVADALCDWLNGKTFPDLHGLGYDALMRTVSDALGEFPPEREQCAAVVFEALRNAMSLYRAARVEEFRGETALICTCFGVSEESIMSVISDNGFTEVDQVAQTYRAGSGCGSCRFLIQELIDLREPDLPQNFGEDAI